MLSRQVQRELDWATDGLYRNFLHTLPSLVEIGHLPLIPLSDDIFQCTSDLIGICYKQPRCAYIVLARSLSLITNHMDRVHEDSIIEKSGVSSFIHALNNLWVALSEIPGTQFIGQALSKFAHAYIDTLREGKVRTLKLRIPRVLPSDPVSELLATLDEKDQLALFQRALAHFGPPPAPIANPEIPDLQNFLQEESASLADDESEESAESADDESEAPVSNEPNSASIEFNSDQFMDDESLWFIDRGCQDVPQSED